ncbi:hypothetical protein [Pseudomonas syringae]|uniref:hypothetical protein n=1 Tax=Pseudomonas syringae TaxID=317 RepID=UPI0013C30E4B|nr:hypothetical protein [Pseudomonas syringae]
MSRLLFDAKELRGVREFSTKKLANGKDVQFAIFARSVLSMKPVGSKAARKKLYPRMCDSVSEFTSRYRKDFPGPSRYGDREKEEMAGRLFSAYDSLDRSLSI